MTIKGKATSLDIAHLAGVSQPTVSRALRGSPSVNEETRQKILTIARELNYKVDKNASNLRCQQSGTLALLFFEDPTQDDSLINPFFLSMLGSITRACALRGYDLLVSFQQLSADWHADFEDSHKADGLILLGYGDYLESQSKLQQLVAQRTHFVRWGAALPGEPGVSIGCDNFAGGRLVGEHLIGLGRKRIAFLGDASGHYPEFWERYRGCEVVQHEAGIPAESALQVDALSSEEEGYEAAKALLGRGVLFDAVFAASDLIAIGAIRALLEHGLRVPEDIAVVGYDDLSVAAFNCLPLTTVRQNIALAGKLLAQNLVQEIQTGAVTHVTLPVELVVRKSA